MTHNEFNDINCKLNQLISNIIYNKNLKSSLSNDQYGNTIWRLKINKLKISICFFDYKNINPFSDIIIPIKVNGGNKGIYDCLELFKNDYCIRGYKEQIIGKLQKFLNRLTIYRNNQNYKRTLYFN